MIPLISTIVIYSLIRPLWFRNTICEKKKKNAKQPSWLNVVPSNHSSNRLPLLHIASIPTRQWIAPDHQIAGTGPGYKGWLGGGQVRHLHHGSEAILWGRENCQGFSSDVFSWIEVGIWWLKGNPLSFYWPLKLFAIERWGSRMRLLPKRKWLYSATCFIPKTDHTTFQEEQTKLLID